MLPDILKPVRMNKKGISSEAEEIELSQALEAFAKIRIERHTNIVDKNLQQARQQSSHPSRNHPEAAKDVEAIVMFPLEIDLLHRIDLTM